MYEQVEEPKENKSRSVANSVAQKKNNVKQSFQFVDNRPESIAQRKMKSQANFSSSLPIQKKENSTGLPDNLKSGIENLSDHSMDDVKVHYNSDKPSQLQAHAYAQGTDIHLATGQEKHLPHEAWHVVQQKQGRVKPTTQFKGVTPVNSDPHLEREADEMGAKADAITDKHVHETPTKIGVRELNVAQLKLIVGANDYSKRYNEEPAVSQDAILQQLVDNAWAEIEKAGNDVANIADPAERTAFVLELKDDEAPIKNQLKKWIRNVPGFTHADPDKSNPLFGRKQQDRNYANYFDLARGVLGWVKGKPVRKNEKRIANFAYFDPTVNKHIDDTLKNIGNKINGLGDPQKTAIIDELKSGKHTKKTTVDGQGKHTEDPLGTSFTIGHYNRELEKTAADSGNDDIKPQIPTDWTIILINPGEFSFKAKIAVLHDLNEYFGQGVPWNPESAGQKLVAEPDESEIQATTVFGANGMRTDSKPMNNNVNRGKGLTHGTRDENAPNTIEARKRNLPVWAGQSMTTARMLKLSQWAANSPEQQESFALGIAAFWRMDYNHTANFAYHTIYEVMDVASNYGVTYGVSQDDHLLSQNPAMKSLRTKLATTPAEHPMKTIASRIQTFETEYDLRVTDSKQLSKDSLDALNVQHSITKPEFDEMKQDYYDEIIVIDGACKTDLPLLKAKKYGEHNQINLLITLEQKLITCKNLQDQWKVKLAQFVAN